VQEGKKAWRFALYDRVRCNLGSEVGWVSGNVQALNEPHQGGSLPYVVMLDRPLKRLITVPTDGNHCVRAEVCFVDGPAGGPCAKAVSGSSTLKRAQLRFALGDRVACLTAGPDGTAWPRRWTAGTVSGLWHQPVGAREGAAVPYVVKLDAGTVISNGQERWEDVQYEMNVLIHQDDHLYVRALEHQPAGDCPSSMALARFTVQYKEEKGWTEKIDQQTLRSRRCLASNSESDESDGE
jgi:hypothetical protein